MIETNSSLPQAPAPSQAQRQAMGRAVMVLAQRRAIAATKQRLRGMGLKPQYMPMREIVALANQYLAAHRAELIDEARGIVDQWQAEGMFGKRGGIRPHRATLNKSARSAKA
jgi:hypothetical protein